MSKRRVNNVYPGVKSSVESGGSSSGRARHSTFNCSNSRQLPSGQESCAPPSLPHRIVPGLITSCRQKYFGEMHSEYDAFRDSLPGENMPRCSMMKHALLINISLEQSTNSDQWKTMLRAPLSLRLELDVEKSSSLYAATGLMHAEFQGRRKIASASTPQPVITTCSSYAATGPSSSTLRTPTGIRCP